MKTTDKTAVKKKSVIDDFVGARLTAEQRAAVEERGKVLVAASAGSGKTSTMIKKIISEIENGTPLSRMLVLVYNEAAANEIKEKLHDALFNAACLSDGERREEFRRDLDELSFANISTIHAFCRALIKDNFEKLGVSPVFDLLSDDQAARYADEALDKLFAECAEADDKVFDELSDILSRERKEEGFRATVKKLYEVYQIQPDGAAFLKRARDNYEGVAEGHYAEVLVKHAHSVFADGLAELEKVQPLLEAEAKSAYAERCKIYADICRQGLAGGFDDILALARADVYVPDLRKGPRTPLLNPDAVDVAESVKSAIDNMFSTWWQPLVNMQQVEEGHAQNRAYVDKLLELVERFDKEYSRAKLADNVLTFNDLERYAAQLISTSPEVAGEFDAVFVDEYQDVNPVQEFIISSVARDNVFMVGDVKQCIYAFRLADPDIFLKRQKAYEAGKEGKFLSFSRNFRSNNTILEFVNSVFDAEMTENTVGVDYLKDGRFTVGEDESAEERKSRRKREAGSVRLHLTSVKNGTRRYSPDEGDFIAEEIKRLVGNAKTGDRLMRYSDCAVLFRNRTVGQRIIERLQASGIPVDDGTLRKEKSAPESDIINFLTVLDNPRQDIPLAGFMLSYFGGFDENKMTLIAARRGDDECLYDAVLRAAEREDGLGRKVVAMLDMLDEYRIKASFKSVPELMQGIVSDFSYDAYMSLEGEGMAAGVLSFISSVAGCEEGCGISKFLAAYNRREKDEERRSAGGDRVIASTFHGYKGLESPVVFVAGLNPIKSGGDNKSAVIADNHGGIGMKFYRRDRRTCRTTLSEKAVKLTKEIQEAKEEMRLFYVALTRAKQYLYITGTVGEKKVATFGKVPETGGATVPYGFLSDAAYRGTPDVLPEIVPENEAREDVEASISLPVLDKARDEDVKNIAEAIAFVYPYAQSTSLAMKYSVSALDGGSDEATMSVFADKADEGTLYHRVMEAIDYEKRGVQGVREEFARFVAEGIMTEEEVAQVDENAIAKCLDSPLMEKARKGKCYREQSFLMYLPARELGQGDTDDKLLVQGVVDLIIDGEERIIVDFKNSALRSDEAMEKYKNQLYLYKNAVEHALFDKVDKLMLYSFKRNEAVEIL